MGKFIKYKVAGNWLYYTSKCLIEAFHVHASKDKKLRQEGSAKFWVDEYGNTKLVDNGKLKDFEITEIKAFIKIHYLGMYEEWKRKGGKEYKKF